MNLDNLLFSRSGASKAAAGGAASGKPMFMMGMGGIGGMGMGMMNNLI